MLYRITVTDGSKIWETEYESVQLFFSLDEARSKVAAANTRLGKGEMPRYIVSYDETPIINSRSDLVRFLSVVESTMDKIIRLGRLIPWIRRKRATIQSLRRDMGDAKKFKAFDVWSDALRELSDCPFRSTLPEHFLNFSAESAKKLDE